MKRLQPLMILMIVVASFASTLADVPPEPGRKRVVLSFIVEPAEDFADYRFFLKSGFALKEFALKKGEKVTMSSMGGGALYRNGKFLAVPTKALIGLTDEPADGKVNPLQTALLEGKVPGTIELIDHSFIRDVPTAEAANWKDPFYRLEKDGETGIKAVLVSGGQPESKTAGTTNPYSSGEPKTPAFWATVVGGSLITLALIFLGVFILRRSRVGGAQSLAK